MEREEDWHRRRSEINRVIRRRRRRWQKGWGSSERKGIKGRREEDKSGGGRVGRLETEAEKKKGKNRSEGE